MSRVLFYKSYPEFYRTLISLADHLEFKKYFIGLADHFQDGNLSDDFSTIYYIDHDPDTNDYNVCNYNIDEAIYQDCIKFLGSPLGQIFPHYRNKTSIQNHIEEIDYALKNVKSSTFYKKFPLYSKSLKKLKEILTNRLKFNHRSRFSIKNNPVESTLKKERSAELEWIYNILRDTDDHTVAIKTIKQALRDKSNVNIDHISWGDKKLYHLSSGKMNGSSCSELLEEIAIQLYGQDKAPGNQMIRSMYFK